MNKALTALLTSTLLLACQLPYRSSMVGPLIEGQTNPRIFTPVRDRKLIHSTGLPSRYEFYGGPLLVHDRQGRGDGWGGQIYAGAYRHLSNPLFGLGLAGEGYLGSTHGELDSGVRLFGVSKLPFLQAGLDHSFRSDETDLIFSLAFPLRRGGLFGKGDSLRIDWLPGRNHSLNVGLTLPLSHPYLGKTRNKHDRVAFPNVPSPPAKQAVSPSPALATVLAHVRHAADWINRYTTPFFDQDLSNEEDELAEFREQVSSFKAHLNLVDAQYPQGHTYAAEISAYHQAIDQAFTLALNGGEASQVGRQQGERIANQARTVLLAEVIIPYNRLIGRGKSNDTLWGYGNQARHQFAAWLDNGVGVPQAQRQAVLSVFEHLITILDENRAGAKTVWGDSSLVWIPLHYGVRPHDYDAQEEMDAILEKVTQAEFAEGNEVYYVINEQFQPEVARMIHAAEDYHVLWIHDYRGVTPTGDPDRLGFGQTLLGYLAAMTNRVRAYDATGKLPVYLTILDQFFYERNQGRLWMELLENPLGHELRLPPGYAAWGERIRNAQNELRSAVAASSRLQEQGRLFGQKWLANTIKVHVSITNPSDFSFRSAYLIDKLPIAPDNLMRDHRKISFYDVTELDPGKGEALYGGMGIGEHYAGPTWEDRAILVRGPALVSLKDAARRVLLQQGLAENEIPVPLRKVPKPPQYAALVDALLAAGWEATVMDVHNETGFGSKPIVALKATLYSLISPGSIIIVPDSLWNSPFWGGMLAGAALRGCRVLVIAPALDNAPSAGFPQMSRAYELFSRLVMIQHALRDELAAVGGMLKAGIYTRTSDVGDTRAKLQEFTEGVRQHPFIKEIFPFGQAVYDVIRAFAEELAATGFQPTYYTEDVEHRKPKLHLKTNFFASAAMQDLLTWDGWDEVFYNYLRYRSSLTARKEAYVDVKDIPEELSEAHTALVNAYWDSLAEDERRRVLYYLTVGSQNQDYRGIIMDGETAAVISSHYSLIGLIDFFFMTGLTTWVDDVQTLDELLPPQSGWRRWLGRYLMKAL